MQTYPDSWINLNHNLLPWYSRFRHDELPNDALMSQQTFLVPSCDIEELEDGYIFSFDMPGMTRENIDIEMQGRELSVTGERRFEKDHRKSRERVLERRYGMMQRVLDLPEDISTERIEATYEHGVLKIWVPKDKEIKAHKVAVVEGKKTSIRDRKQDHASMASKLNQNVKGKVFKASKELKSKSHSRIISKPLTKASNMAKHSWHKIRSFF